MALAPPEASVERYVASDPDVRLMLRVRDDDPHAFEELVERFQKRLIHFLRHFVGNAHQAEDIAQEVFLRVFRVRKKYVPMAKFSTWLFTIANNAALNSIRSRSKRKEVHIRGEANDSLGLGDPLESLAVAASGQMPTRVADSAEVCDMVREALGDLKENQRLAILLTKFEGMSYDDVAAAMETTPQAVKSLLFRARENLKLALDPYFREGRASTPN